MVTMENFSSIAYINTYTYTKRRYKSQNKIVTNYCYSYKDKLYVLH